MAKDASMTIRVDAELLKAFTSACKDQDVTASQILRAAMRSFLESNPQPSLPFGGASHGARSRSVRAN